MLNPGSFNGPTNEQGESMLKKVKAFASAAFIAGALLVNSASSAQAADYVWTLGTAGPTVAFGQGTTGVKLTKTLEVKNAGQYALSSVSFASWDMGPSSGVVVSGGASTPCPMDQSSAITLNPGDSCLFSIEWTPASGTVYDRFNLAVANSTYGPVTITGTAASGGSSGSGFTASVADDEITWSGATGGVAVFVCPTTVTNWVVCDQGEHYRKSGQLSSPLSLTSSDFKYYEFGFNPQTQTPFVQSAISSGDYHFFVLDLGSSGAPPVVGPLSYTVGGTTSPNPVPVFPAINAAGVPTVSGSVVGSTVKCVAPSYDTTPTSVELSLKVDGVELKSASLTAGPFEVSAAVPAGSTGKTVMCVVTARNAEGSLTNASEAVIAATAGTTTPTTPTTPTTCSGTKVVGFGNAMTKLSAAGAGSVTAFAGSACKYTVTGYSQPSSSRASALAAARANAVAAAIKKANPAAEVTVVNGGKTKNASCAKVSNRCVVVSRG